jgi:low affinity Fe/Cu permease
MKPSPLTKLGKLGQGIFRPPVIAAFVVLLMATAGYVFRLGPDWRYITDGVTAFAVILVLWEVQRQRQRTAARTAEQIDELLRLLRSARSNLSNTELKNIEADLQRLQVDVLSRTTFKR